MSLKPRKNPRKPNVNPSAKDFLRAITEVEREDQLDRRDFEDIRDDIVEFIQRDIREVRERLAKNGQVLDPKLSLWLELVEKFLDDGENVALGFTFFLLGNLEGSQAIHQALIQIFNLATSNGMFGKKE